jgi:hypothetical protein
VHAPDYTLKKLKEAETLINGATATLTGTKVSQK